MRVLSITPTFFPEVGGLEQVVFELAQRVDPLGVHMEVAHVAPGLSRSVDDVKGVTVHRLPLLGNRILGWAPSLGELARGFDLLHVHDPQLLALSGNVRWRCADIPAVLSTHGGFWHTKRHKLVKEAYEATLLPGYVAHYRRVLASSINDFKYFNAFSDHTVLCSNGVPVKSFNAVKAKDRRSLFQWIYWGRLSRNKRVDLAIEYVGHARRLGYPVELLICGKDFDGLLPGLQELVRRMDLHTAVRFEPYLDEAALHAELAQRGVYVTASEHEGFGLSLVEALAAGLIVVCRDIAPINSFFRNREAGCLLRFDGTPADVEALCEVLGSAATQASAMSEAARAAAVPHDWDVVAPLFVNHYREVLAE